MLEDPASTSHSNSCWTYTRAINNTNINACAVDLSSKILKCWYTNADSLINKIDEL